MNQNDKNNLINDADDAAFRQAVQRKSGKKLASAPLSKEAKARRKKKKLILGITIPLGIIVLFGALYATFVFSSIPFVKYWRTIYIETAMSTGHHHWLAEKFIPDFIEVIPSPAKSPVDEKTWVGSAYEDIVRGEFRGMYYCSDIKGGYGWWSESRVFNGTEKK